MIMAGQATAVMHVERKGISDDDDDHDHDEMTVVMVAEAVGLYDGMELCDKKTRE